MNGFVFRPFEREVKFVFRQVTFVETAYLTSNYDVISAACVIINV
jgi:hypothetical protein